MNYKKFKERRFNILFGSTLYSKQLYLLQCPNISIVEKGSFIKI